LLSKEIADYNRQIEDDKLVDNLGLLGKLTFIDTANKLELTGKQIFEVLEPEVYSLRNFRDDSACNAAAESISQALI